MVKSRPAVCPHCEQSDQTIKVSKVYIQAISTQYLHGKAKKEWHEKDAELEDENAFRLPPNQTSALAKKLMPPSGQTKKNSDYIHPDAIMIAFSFVTLFFVYQILKLKQLPGILFMAAIIIIGYGAYFFFRKEILRRYQARKNAITDESKLVEKAVNRWMKLHYCDRDKGVFDPEQKKFFTFEELPGYLYQELFEKK